MKKLILSSVFAILMFFSRSADAYAQEFCALGSFAAGEQISAYITMVSNEAVVEAEGLPEGLYLAQTHAENGKHISLEGAAVNAGELNFSLIVSEEPGLIICSAYFEPALPQLSISGDISCAANDIVEISVNASVSDNGSLSYQWYSGAPLIGSPIPGATDSTYRPDTSQSGQQTYFCLVTNSNGDYSVSAESDIILVTVAEPVLSSIEIEYMPEKLLYAPGDSIDTEGLILRAVYDNGSSELVDSGFDVYPSRFDAPGKQLVEISYKGLRCYYEVEISLAAVRVDGIGVLSLPRKTEYETGEIIDTTGLVIRAYTKNGSIDIDSGFEVSPQKLKEEGRQTVTVSFGGKECSFTVNVEDSNRLKSIAIASLPIRREYRVGDSVDISGLSLQLIYGGRTELVTSGFDYSPKQLSQAGIQEISVKYGEHSAKFSITVKNEAASPSPAPTAKPSSAPTASPQPSETPARVDRDHHARDVNALVKIIFAVALVSLAALAGYIVIMQKRGKR